MMSLSVPNTGIHHHPRQVASAPPSGGGTGGFVPPPPGVTPSPPQRQAFQQQHRVHSSPPDQPTKRPRGADEGFATQQQQQPPRTFSQTHEEATQPPHQTAAKKTRSNKFIRPKEIPKTLINAMGTLVPAPFSGAAVSAADFRNPFHNNANTNNAGLLGRQVPLRRQLSGGRIDAYLGNGDNNNDNTAMAMDTESTTHSARPRSMSF